MDCYSITLMLRFICEPISWMWDYLLPGKFSPPSTSWGGCEGWCECFSAGEEREAVSEAAPAVHPDHLHPARWRNPAQQPRRPLPLAAQGAHVCARLLGEKLFYVLYLVANSRGIGSKLLGRLCSPYAALCDADSWILPQHLLLLVMSVFEESGTWDVTLLISKPNKIGLTCTK